MHVAQMQTTGKAHIHSYKAPGLRVRKRLQKYCGNCGDIMQQTGEDTRLWMHHGLTG